MAVYVPPSANAHVSCDVVYLVISRLQTVSEEFNHASPSHMLSTYSQYDTYSTGDNKILDILYANTKEAYSSSPLPPQGRLDHNLVHLLPVYKLIIYRNLSHVQ